MSQHGDDVRVHVIWSVGHWLMPGDVIVGDVILCTRIEAGAGEED